MASIPRKPRDGIHAPHIAKRLPVAEFSAERLIDEGAYEQCEIQYTDLAAQTRYRLHFREMQPIARQLDGIALGPSADRGCAFHGMQSGECDLAPVRLCSRRIYGLSHDRFHCHGIRVP
jgi:hypothetical protein